jgi:hypothetical protein
LEFVVGRARPNTVRAYAHDLSVNRPGNPGGSFP